MDMADNWLGVPKLLTPEEIVNPNVDELSMMTYLSNFPNSKVIKFGNMYNYPYCKVTGYVSVCSFICQEGFL